MSTVIAPSVTAWSVDPTHTNVEFSVRHLMIATVKGRFADVSGTVTTDDADPRNGSVDITIGVSSVDTREERRDAHLRSADFFDAEKFPAMTFRSTRIEPGSDGALTLIGELTIRGVTKEVALAVASEGRAKDPWGGERAGFTATGKVKRGDFGLTWNQALETGGVVVGDEVKISLDVELLRQGA
jgi:polyisoprenoid-binding protein YceI